jgi:hypothetical protein
VPPIILLVLMEDISAAAHRVNEMSLDEVKESRTCHADVMAAAVAYNVLAALDEDVQNDIARGKIPIVHVHTTTNTNTHTCTHTCAHTRTHTHIHTMLLLLLLYLLCP